MTTVNIVQTPEYMLRIDQFWKSFIKKIVVERKTNHQAVARPSAGRYGKAKRIFPEKPVEPNRIVFGERLHFLFKFFVHIGHRPYAKRDGRKRPFLYRL